MRAVMLAGVIVLAAGLAVWLVGEGPQVNPWPRPRNASRESMHGATLESAALPGELASHAGMSIEVAPEELEPLAEAFYTLHVRAVFSRSEPDAPKLPATGVRVELGIGERARTQRGNSWAQAATHAEQLGESLTEQVTDADGRCVLHLPWSAFEAVSESAQPWLRTSKPGHFTAVRFEPRPQLPGEVVERTAFQQMFAQTRFGESQAWPLVVAIQPGVLLEAQLIGSDGVAVEGAVKPYYRDADGSWGWDREVEADASGRATLELTRETEYVLIGKGRSRDAPRPPRNSWIEIFDLTLNTPEPFVVRHLVPPEGPRLVRVEAGRVLKGRVLDSDGEPVGGLDLHAKWPALLDAEAQRVSRRVLDAEGLGLSEAHGRTDATGRFELLGLREGEYRLSAQPGGFLSAQQQLGPEVLPADGVERVLTLDHPHLAIHLRNADGSAFTGSMGVADARSFGGYLGTHYWYDDPYLVVARRPDQVVPDEQTTGYVAATEAGPGEFTVPVEPGACYQLGILRRGVPWRALAVDVPEVAGRVDVDLVIPEVVGDGTLVLEVLSALGEPVHDDLSVRLLDAESLTLLYEDRVFYSETWPVRIPAPVGRYVLQVDSITHIDHHHGRLMDHRAHGGTEQRIELTDGTELPVTARLGSGARLALRVEGAADDADREAANAELFGMLDGPSLEFYASRVTVSLSEPRRAPRPVLFAIDQYPEDWGLRRGTYASREILLGSALTSELVTAGTYTLVATLPGGRELRREVELFDGVTTDVRLEFE